MNQEEFKRQFLGDWTVDERFEALVERLQQYYRDTPDYMDNRDARPHWEAFKKWCSERGYTKTEVDRAKSAANYAGRGTGTTTKQMLEAPKDSIFIWCNGDITYPKGLAIKLDRQDLEIVPISWLHSDRFRGCRPSAVIIDHAVEPYHPNNRRGYETLMFYLEGRNIPLIR